MIDKKNGSKSFTKLNQLLGRFRKEAGGQVAMSFALVALPFTAMIGGAIDFSNTSRSLAMMQSAADAAVIAAATALASGKNLEEKIAIANKAFKYNLPEKISRDFIGEPNTNIDFPNKQVKMVASVSSKSYFGGLLQEYFDLSVTSVAIVEEGSPICMMSLNKSVEKAISLNGTADIVAEGCSVHVNSKHANALVEVGTGLATAESFCVRGGASGTGFSPKPNTGCFEESDPLASKMATAWATIDSDCTVNNLPKIQKDTALAPGVYCGGITVKKGIVTLQEGGTYIFKNGPLSVSAQGRLQGEKVTLLFTGDSSTRVVTQGGADFDISAKTTGPFAGIAIAMHSSVTPDKDNLITGGGYMSIDGIIYFPKQHLSIQGNGVIGEDTDQFAIIADTISVQGKGLLTIKITAEYEEFSELPELPKSSEKIRLVQ